MEEPTSLKPKEGLSRRAFGAGVASAAATAGLGGIASLVPASGVRANSDLFASLRAGGHVGLMRHALAPGFSDPDGFRLDDCATQRNLSDEGRAQARRTGEYLRAVGIGEAEIYSSRWCRCLDTARLLELGPVTPLALLDSFFQDRTRGPQQTAALRAWIAKQPLAGPLLLVTHQVNISALAGIAPRSAEIVVMRREADGTLATLGRALPT